MRKLKFDNTSIYHIYNRGVEKRNIFLDKQDCLRFIHNLFEFNDQSPAEKSYYRLNKNVPWESGTPRVKLVEIYAFCLMPNHFHLFLKQKEDGGISKFMNKLGVGYSMYFNKKYDRVGGLFQGRFKAVRIERKEHYIHIPYYIHLNPLGLVEPEWKDGKIKDFDKMIEFLESYRWSSYLDYIGKKNFPSVIEKEFLSEFFETPENYRKETINWLENINLENIKPLTLDY